MSSFFDELEAQLHAAARAQIAANRSQRPGRSGWPRSAVRAIPVLLAVTTSIAVAAFALVLLGHTHSHTPPHQPVASPPPASGPPTFPHLSRIQQRELIYLEKAQGAAFGADQACGALPAGLGDPGHKPSLSEGSPSGAALAILGVLRRPAAPSDRLPPGSSEHRLTSRFTRTARSRRSRMSTCAISARRATASEPTTTSSRPAT
jgi:hypothetical protein